MNIKVLMLDQDTKYMESIYSSFQRLETNGIELFCSDKPEDFYNLINVVNPDIYIVSEGYVDMIKQMLHKNTGMKKSKILVITSNKNIKEFDGFSVLFRYRGLSEIKQDLIRFFNDKASTDICFKDGGKDGNAILFTSAAGGCGVTSVAAAYAMRVAGKGHKTLYIELNQLQSSELIFSGSGSFTYSDVIYALLQHRNNLGIRLTNFADRDVTGVGFYHKAVGRGDMKELHVEEKKLLIDTLKNESDFEYIIVDMNATDPAETGELMECFDKVIMISDGTELNNYKSEQLINLLPKDRLSGVRIFYNRFGSRTGKHMENAPVSESGGINRIEAESIMDIERYIRDSKSLDSI